MNDLNIKKIATCLGAAVSIILVLLVQWSRASTFDLLVWLTLLVFGYIATVYDIREQRVPNRLIGAMLGVWILLVVPQLFFQTEAAIAFLLRGIIGCILGGIVFLAVYIVSRKGLGGGDVKLMAASGLYLGVNGVMPTMLYGSVLAAVVGLILILTKKIDKKDPIPLVPFLYLGMILTMLIVL